MNFQEAWRKKFQKLQKFQIAPFRFHGNGSHLWKWQSVLDKNLCDKVCQSLATGLWFSLVSSPNI